MNPQTLAPPGPAMMPKAGLGGGRAGPGPLSTSCLSSIAFRKQSESSLKLPDSPMRSSGEARSAPVPIDHKHQMNMPLMV